ncbi:MAG: alpha/beta hydrolase [Rhodospirillaceae bacterium]|nr:alpha/beta hydrolase [Rhodospirillaceae bacterium]
MDTGDTFQFLVDSMADTHSFIAPDWRGFGRSAWEAHGYWFANYLADLDAFLDIISPQEPVSIIGHSMGGNVASLYAGVRPERVARLVNVEGFGLPRSDPQRAPERYREWLEQLKNPPGFAGYATAAQLAGFLMRRNPRLTAERADFIAHSWTRANASGQRAIRSDPRHKLVNPVIYRREEAEACWSRITAPVLMLLAEHSEFLGRLGADGSLDRLGAVFRTAQVQVVPGVGHMMHHEQPAEVARRIEDFFASAVRPPPEGGTGIDIDTGSGIQSHISGGENQFRRRRS